MKIAMCGYSDVGKKRENNQDYIIFDETLGIGIVADGIGGRHGGEIASRIGGESVFLTMKNIKDLPSEHMLQAFRNSVLGANQSIMDYGKRHPEVYGMGTTLEALYFREETLFLVHLGDSRTYLWSNHQLWQMTLDHNVETFVERGWIDPHSLHPQTHGSALVRALGIGECVPDIYSYSCKSGDLFVTSSDGLFDMIEDEKIEEIIASTPFAELPKKLIDAANANGGKDNITVLVSQVVSL